MRKIMLAMMFIGSACLANRESGGRNGASAVFVYFSSIGSGIDYKTQALYTGLIQKAKTQGLVINETLVPRGREGEGLYCVELTSAYARYDLIKALAPAILLDRRVMITKRTIVYAGSKCTDRDPSEQDLGAYVSKY